MFPFYDAVERPGKMSPCLRIRSFVATQRLHQSRPRSRCPRSVFRRRERKTCRLKLRFYCAAAPVNIYLSSSGCSFPFVLSCSLINTRCPLFSCNLSLSFLRHFTLRVEKRNYRVTASKRCFYFPRDTAPDPLFRDISLQSSDDDHRLFDPRNIRDNNWEFVIDPSLAKLVKLHFYFFAGSCVNNDIEADMFADMHGTILLTRYASNGLLRGDFRCAASPLNGL